MIEGSVRGVRKPQNHTEICQKTANCIGFVPEYRNHTYREAHYMKADVTKTWGLLATEIINIRAKLNPLNEKGTSMTFSLRERQKERKLTSSLNHKIRG